MASESLSGAIPGGAWSITHASSSGSLLSASADESPTGGGGGAIHAQLTRAVGNDRLSLLFDQTGLGYSDPFGGLSTPGLLNESLTYDHKFAAGQGEVSLNVNRQSNVGIDGGASTSQSEAQLRVRRALGKRLTLNAEVDRTVSTSSAVGPSLAVPTPAPSGSPSAYDVLPVPAQESTQVKVGADWRVTNAASLSVDRLETLGGTNTVDPSQTDAQLSYDLGKAGRIYARERWSAAPVLVVGHRAYGERQRHLLRVRRPGEAQRRPAQGERVHPGRDGERLQHLGRRVRRLRPRALVRQSQQPVSHQRLLAAAHR